LKRWAIDLGEWSGKFWNVKRTTPHRSKRGEQRLEMLRHGKSGGNKIVNLLDRLRDEPYSTKAGDTLLKKILADDSVL